MKLSLKTWQIFGFAFSVIFGTLLHFLFVWSGQRVIFAPFSAVNESTFEHMKILFFPLFIFAIIEWFFIGKDYKNYWCVKIIGIIIGVLLIPILFYTYTGVFGVSVDFINILIFFVASAISFAVETRLLKSKNWFCRYPFLAFGIICLIVELFIIFTFSPPEIPLFKDPITSGYGI